MMGWLQDYFERTYKGRKPPKKIESFHCAIWKKQLKDYLDNWKIVEQKFKVQSDTSRRP